MRAIDSSDDEVTFGVWLLTQHDRSDWVGDLARAARADRKFPRAGDPEAVRSHPSSMQAESEMLEALDDADLRVLAASRYFYETFRLAGTHQCNDDNQLGKALGNLGVMERQGPQGHLR